MHGSREARADRLQAAAQRDAIASLDDQMGVVALEREVDDAKLPALTRDREGVPELADQPGAPQGRNAVPQPPRHEARKAPREGLPTAVSHRGPGTGSAAGAEAATTPVRGRAEMQVKLRASLLHDREHELAV